MRTVRTRPTRRQAAAVSFSEVVAAFLDRGSKHTAKGYAADLRDFATFLKVSGPAEALAKLAKLGQGAANYEVRTYQNALRKAGKSPATINRRLAAIQSLLKAARQMGACTLILEIDRERDQQYRDTRGPSIEKVRAISADLGRDAADGNKKAVRDLAIVRLLFNLGLRSHEIVGLDLKHYDRDGKRLSILGKQRIRREWVTVSSKATESLEAWLTIRGEGPGAIFLSMRRTAYVPKGTLCRSSRRLHREDIYRLLKPWGIRPHGLRHAAITAALEATGGDIAKVQKFSRHSNPIVLMAYDDNRKDEAGRIAGLLDDLTQ